MANSKKNKFKAALDRIPKEKLSFDDQLSSDLALRVGQLEDKGKITIRLDVRVLEAAKREADSLGIGYQKIINDRLLDMYSISEAPYLKKNSPDAIAELSKKIEELKKRLNKVERTQDKKRA